MKLQIVVILICCTFGGYAQKLQGKFIQQRAIDAGVVLTFDHNKFIYEKGGCVNGEVGIGTFTFSKKQLKLKFKKIKDQASSKYSLKISPGSVDSVRIKVRVLDDLGSPMQGTIAIRDKDYAVIEQFHPNRKGDVFISLKSDKRFGCMTIDNLGYYRVTFPFSKLKNKHSEIDVKLSPATIYYILPKKMVYKVEKFNNGELTLVTADSGRLFFALTK